MKKCQFCAEEIQDAAVVCKHCGRDLMVSLTKIEDVIQPYLLADYKITKLTNTSATLVYEYEIRTLPTVSIIVFGILLFWFFPLHIMGIYLAFYVDKFFAMVKAKKDNSVFFHVYPDGQVRIIGYTLDVLQIKQKAMDAVQQKAMDAVQQKAMDAVQQTQKNIHEKGMLRFVVVPMIVCGLIFSTLTVFILSKMTESAKVTESSSVLVFFSVVWALVVLLRILGWFDNEKKYRKIINS